MDYVIQTPLQLSSHLRALRRARGLSQAALGEALGVGQTRVARIEGNPTVVSMEQLIEVLGVLGVQLVLREVEPVRDAATSRTSKGHTQRGATRRRPTGDTW